MNSFGTFYLYIIIGKIIVKLCHAFVFIFVPSADVIINVNPRIPVGYKVGIVFYFSASLQRKFGRECISPVNG
jgi:hypothetical protein